MEAVTMEAVTMESRFFVQYLSMESQGFSISA